MYRIAIIILMMIFILCLTILPKTFGRDAEVETRGYFEPNRDILAIVVGWTDSMGRFGPLHPTVEEPKDTVYVNVTKDGYLPADTSFRVLEDGQDINLHLKMQAI